MDAPKCKNNNTSLRCKMTTDDFVKKSKFVHGDTYDYSKSFYIDNNNKVCITCSIHGDFYQLPSNHYSKSNKNGCPKCSKKGRLTNKEFKTFCSTVHNNKYDYSKTNLVNNRTKIKILCPIHGEFLQLPKHHKNGFGCFRCNIDTLIKKKISKSETEFLNYLNITKRNVWVDNFVVDGIDSLHKTIYEFLGDYWHCNPKLFDGNKIHPFYQKPNKEVLEYTFLRFEVLKRLGYEVKYIWERDWKNFKKGIDSVPKICQY